MQANSTPGGGHSRRLILTQEVVDLLEMELRKRWEHSDARYLDKDGNPRNTPKKLSRDDKADMLGLEKKTIDAMLHCQPVSESSLRTAFNALNIPFSKEHHCVSTPPSAGNLPSPPHACIGRETQVTEVKALLESARLVTLTGTGGIGKTRLAIEVAQELKSRYPAGVWLVELAGVAEPTLVMPTVAVTVGVQERKDRSPLNELTAFLCDKQLLLVLDNCEHQLNACAALLDHLLSSCPGLVVLATSRERLNISFEYPYPVPALTVPDLHRLSGETQNIAKSLLDYDSVRLFVERARKLHPGFTVTDENAPLLASICRRLDGIPLALELAAARARTMPLDKLEGRLNDCFRLLTGGSRAALPRHQTLRAAMDWSYDLLTEKEKALLCRLSVFVEGATLEAVEQVCAGKGIEEGDVLDLLTSLADKSLVTYREREGKERYSLLETVRQYGGDRLAESGGADSVQRRHRDYFLAWAEAVEPNLKGVEAAQWLQRLEAEHGNLRAALQDSLEETGSNAALRLCGALMKFWEGNGHLTEGRDWCARALAKTDAQPHRPERAKVLNGTGILAMHLGDYPAAIAMHQQSLAIHQANGDRRGAANALNGLGHVTLIQGDYASARSWYEESLALLRELGDQVRIANALSNLGGVAYYEGQYECAHPFFVESLTIRKKNEDLPGIAAVLGCLGDVAQAQGDYASARSWYEESLVLIREFGSPSGITRTLHRLGNVFLAQGKKEAARSCYDESVGQLRKIDKPTGIAVSLEGFAALSAADGKMERAAMLWGAAEAFRQERGSPRSVPEREAYEPHVAKVRQTLGEETFLAAWTQGQCMSLEQAGAYALEES